MDERKRDSVVVYIRRRMAACGISMEQLAAALSNDNAAYRNAEGKTWNGRGDMPQWMQHAVSAGQAPEHFAIDDGARASPRGVDRGKDPFAGSRLATIKL